MESTTGNSYNKIVSGSRVLLPDSNRIYDVGEIIDEDAHLFYENKEVGWFPSKELVVV